MSKSDSYSLNDETNALAARLDGLEAAVGSTMTQVVLDQLKGVSEALKALGAPSVDESPVVKKSVAPKAGS